MTTLNNLLDPALDITGTLTQKSNLNLSDEVEKLGDIISGQVGTSANVTNSINNIQTINNITGMSIDSIGNFITLESINNNGTFLIVSLNNSTSVNILNSSGIAENNVIWIERKPYTLETDLNYIRTDRESIKGVNYYENVPTYFKCNNLINSIDVNLANIAGKTTDAKSIIINKEYNNANVSPSDGYITINDPGNLKHADFIDPTGIPINDGYDAGNEKATYVEIIADGYGLNVLTGPNKGNRIFGRSRSGNSISPNSVEIEFRSVPPNSSISSSIPYYWETEQVNIIDLYFGYRECLYNIPETAFRTTLVSGLISDATLRKSVEDILQVIGVEDNETNINNKLTNKDAYYSFYNLENNTPTIVDALNVLNEQIGNRTYTGDILSDGYTTTQSLQQLSDAIGGSSGLPKATQIGQLLYCVDGENYQTSLPVTSRHGWLVNEQGIHIVIPNE